jgi:hypothetical protein
LRLADGAKVQVTKAECSNPAITTVLEDAATGLSSRVQVMIPKGTDLTAKGETLTVYTDDPEFAKLVCPIDTVRLSQDPMRRASGPPPGGAQQVSAATLAPATQAMARSRCPGGGGHLRRQLQHRDPAECVRLERLGGLLGSYRRVRRAA